MLSLLFADMESSPFEKIGDYLDDGPQIIETGNKRATVGDTVLEYGPRVNFTLATKSDRKVLTFADPCPYATAPTAGCQIRAKITQLEFLKNGDTIASGTIRFGLAFRKKISLVGVDA